MWLASASCKVSLCARHPERLVFRRVLFSGFSGALEKIRWNVIGLLCALAGSREAIAAGAG